MDEDIEASAVAWYDRLERDPSPTILAAFEAWCARDLRHRHAFDQQVRLAESVTALGWTGTIPAPRPAVAAVSWKRIGVGTALAAAMIAFLFATLSSGRTPSQDGRTLADAGDLLTRPFRLADGSIAVLGDGAALVAQDPSRPRQIVLLNGSARFLVVHDPEHPFLVTAGATEISARGTTFDVTLSAAGARVALLDGRVDVARRGSAAVVSLQPGETLAPDDATPMVRAGIRHLGPIDADSLPLVDIILIANRQARRQIRLGNPELARRRITGRFDVSDPPTLARKLAATLDLIVTDQRGYILLAPR